MVEGANYSGPVTHNDTINDIDSFLDKIVNELKMEVI